MAFKKTSAGRVFFQNPDEINDLSHKKTRTSTSSPSVLRTGQSQAGGAANQSQTQFQIIALLKTLNAKLQNTQAERDAMKQQIDRYEKIVTRLEEKANYTHDAYEQLSQSVKSKDTEILAQSRRAEQIAQEAFGELAEARQLIIELEEKAEFSEKELKRHASQREKIESDIAARQAEFEQFQKTLSDHALTNKNLTKRLNKTEEQTQNFDLQLGTALSRQDTLDRKLEKTVQDRTRMLRKVDRIEEAVIQTRDAMNSKAMTLLTDNETGVPTSFKDIDESTIQKFLRSQSHEIAYKKTIGILPWWKQPLPMNALNIVSFIAMSVLAGWFISDIQKPVMSDAQEHEAFNRYEMSRSVQDSLSTEENKSSSPTKILASLGQAGLEQTTKLKAVADDVVSKIIDADNATTPKAITDTDTTARSLNSFESQNTAFVDPTLNNGVNITNESKLVQDFDDHSNALTKQPNALEPHSVPNLPSPAEVASSVDTAIELKIEDIPSAFAYNPEQYNKADSNLPEAVKQIETKALEGDSAAQHDLAAIYTAGHGGVQQDYTRAAYWFEKSARANISNAAYNLGVLYHQGLGVDSDVDMAISWYKAAAQMGHPEAQYNLGIAHIESVGVEYDPFKATTYFEKAANNNVVEAAYNLGLIHENGLLGESKPDEAVMWYKLSADQGSPEAREALQQLAKSLNVSLEDVNRLATNVKAAKDAQANINNEKPK